MLPKNTEEALSFHKWHQPPRHVWRNVKCMLYTPAGNTAFDNPIHYPKKKNGERVKGYDTTYHRLFWDKPAATITKWNGIMGSQNNVHPDREWKKDENGNDILLSLKEADVGAIYLGKTATDFTVYNDDVSDRRPVAKVRSSGIYLHEDGRSGVMHQMDF